MRNLLALIVGSTLLAAACGSSSEGTSGTSGGAATSGGTSGAAATTSGGSTTGSQTSGTTTGGSTTGLLAAGAPCTSNAACTSDFCGVDGTGNCCSVACSTSDAACGATACDATGACAYPSASTACGGAASCSNGTLTAPGACDGSGTCSPATPHACAGNFACASATACATTCASSGDCQSGFSCNAGACVSPAATGSCTENDDCTSGVCGLNGTGNCCAAACSTSDATCGATACDLTGACTYPQGTACGTDSCAAAELTTGACGSTGSCAPSTAACANGLACNAAGTGCLASCGGDTDCASGFYCLLATGTCTPQQAVGPCSANDACVSGVCGIAGSGNCCTAACSNSDATCGATDCDAKSGACDYPGSAVLCGSVAESCTGNTQQNPSACDGTGSCNNAPGTTDCTPYICGATACFSSCTDDTSCGSGDFCDIGNAACCAGIAGDGTGAIAVDSVNGSDSNACCGYGSAKPCATLSQAMKLIDASQAPNVTITATVSGGGGDWAPKGELYPIKLGWGVELSAPGVYFTDVNADAEIFDVSNYSANDTVGYASIAGTAASNVWIGMDSTMVQNQDPSAIQVEAGNTLYLSNATVNGNPSPNSGVGTTAITVVAGASLVVGQDQSAANTGTVSIGGGEIPDGYNGIVCTSANGLGCTITDAALDAGSSLAVQFQDGVDIDAEDYASISLTSAPAIGVAPSAVGFGQCSFKDDADLSSLATPAAILLNGAVTMTFDNGTVSCISGDGFLLQSTANGSPSLTIDSSTIENTELGVYASAGTATITNTTIQYNYNGAEQDSNTSAGTTGTISLGGGGNTVVCSSNLESSLGGSNPGISVLNTTDAVLDASKTAWDTKTPDVFQCDATFATCTCEVTACTDNAGADGMDAVYESTTTGTITTTGNTQSSLSCAPPATCNVQNNTGCPAGERCCNSILKGGQPFCEMGNFCPG